MSNYYTVGKIVNTHGIRGEVRVITISDFGDERYRQGSTLSVFTTETSERGIDVTVKQHRKHKQFDLLSFEGYDSIEDVTPFKGSLLKVAAEDRSSFLEDNEFYFDQIIGCEVKSEQGTALGRITSILTPGANDVWVMEPYSGTSSKEVLIPYITDVVKQVNVKDREVIIHLMPGLMDDKGDME
jgi:16S rRNA processing protein RimM